MGTGEWNGTDGMAHGDVRPTRVPVYQRVATMFGRAINGVRRGRVALSIQRNRLSHLAGLKKSSGGVTFRLSIGPTRLGRL